ncbi:MAG: hypothetical protein ONB05_00155 [candidate division KSB1 bacterium]|nr:hypothetical protein [candidate division KSB1 bacterium]
MATFKITFQLKSSLNTPLQADILFGHLAWAYRYLKGEEALESFLKRFQDAPTLISDGFPEGFFPRPILRPFSIQESKDLGDNLTSKKDLVAHLDRLKQIKKLSYLPCSLIEKYKERLSYINLYREILQQYADYFETGHKRPPVCDTEIVSHNTINRLSFRVVKTGGGFFQKEESFYETRNPIKFWFLVQTEQWTKDDLTAMMEYIEYSGYGGDQSTGKGYITQIEIDAQYQLPQAQNPNAFVSLSSFVPSPKLGLQGYYELITKFGKFGGSYATVKIPFKKPFIMMKTGSTFLVEKVDGQHYGCLLSDVHYEASLLEKPIKHYAYAFPFYVRLEP